MSIESRVKSCQPKTQLPRVFGLFDVTSIVIGGIIGSGIFLVPYDIAQNIQSPLLMLAVWVVGGFLSFLGALGLAELGAAMPEAGGIYVYLREAYGSFISFLFGWTLFLVIDSGAIATLAVAFSTNFPSFMNMSPLVSKLVAVIFIIFLAAVNYFGARQGGNLQNLLTVIKIMGIAGICAAAFLSGKGNLSNFITPGPGKFSLDSLSSFGVALIATFWAYKGWETATYSAGEVKNPQRNLPLGILIGLFGVIVIYLLANLAYLYVLPVSAMTASKDGVAANAMKIAIGPIGAYIISVIILFSVLGAANQNMLCSPRVYFAMARDKLFFKSIARVHPKYKTPYVSIIAISLWSIVLSLSGTFQQLFTYVVFGEWIFFGLTIAAVFILRRKRPDLPRPYKTWGYPFAPAIFILAALAISVNSLIKQFFSSMAGLGIIFLGIPAYLYWKKRQKK
jgi:APA family basic amino acid/polyamine antiporter